MMKANTQKKTILNKKDINKKEKKKLKIRQFDKLMENITNWRILRRWRKKNLRKKLNGSRNS